VTQTAPGATPGTGLTARAASWYAALPPRRRDVAQDTVLALTLALLNLLSLLPYQSQLHLVWPALLLVTGQCLPLALRRVWPVPVLIGCGLLRNAYDVLHYGYAPLPLAPAIALATVADRSGRLLRWITIVATVAGVGWSQVLPGHNQPYDAIVQWFIFGAAWTVGTLSRHRRAVLTATASRAERAEASLDAAAASAAMTERVRIARELHDVVAHHVSLMAVQAEAVGALLPARPEAAATSADLIGSTARAAMAELRRLLGVLRFTDSDDPERTNPLFSAFAQADRRDSDIRKTRVPRLTPVPSLSRLDELTEAMRRAGLGVTCETSGPVTPLPPGIDLTAYRIIQEALTNAVRHAPGAAASVRVTYEPSHLSVAVTNTAPAQAPPPVPVGAAVARGASAGPVTAPAPAASDPATAPPAPPGLAGPGYGLAGIAERVASCGGALSLGPGEDGGFTVSARLPLT
jgi:signal transduction histidine kinase